MNVKKIKQYADSGDLKELKYIFVDSLDVDPTFASYEEGFYYCKNKFGLLEKHVELTTFTYDQTQWTESYWSCLKIDLIKNFSVQRMEHMREVAQVLLREKVQRIQEERSSKDEETKKNQFSNNLSPSVEPKNENGLKTPPMSKSEEQALILEQEKQRLEEENYAIEEEIVRKAMERAKQIEEQRRKKELEDTESLKKVIGIVVAAVVVITVIVFVLLK